MPAMRTTLTVEDHLFKELKQVAHETNRSLKDVVNHALREGLRSVRRERPPRPFRTRTYSMGRPTGFNLDKALHLAATMEEEEQTRKMVLRK
jgi:hypothetical protein